MKSVFAIILFSILFFQSQSQSINVSLFGKIIPDTTGDVHFTGIWGYVSPDGTEYALLGGLHGLFVIDVSDSMNLRVIDSVPARDAYWREVKVIGHYAYVTSQVFDDSNAMQIIDLSYLPDSVHLAATFDSTFTSAHTIERNMTAEDYCLYVCGPLPTNGTNGGVHILDVSNPEKPVELSAFSTNWIHDCYVRGDTMYACESFGEKVDVVDIHNRRNPIQIGEIDSTGLYTHSCWTSDDGKSLMVCAEVDNYPAHVYSLNDLSNISEIAVIRCIDSTTLVHNVMIKDKFAYVAENDAGFLIYDFSDPALPVQVGYYQTFKGAPQHSVGCYHVYVFLPSGKLLVSDRWEGLYVLLFHSTRAVRIYGDVVNANDQPLYNASIHIGNFNTTTDLAGHFKIGFVPEGNELYHLSASSNSIEHADTFVGFLHQGDSLYFHLKLDSQIVTAESYPSEILLKENPVSDVCTFQILNEKDHVAKFALTDMEGKILSQKVLSVQDNSEIVTLTIPLQPSGIYVAKVSIGSIVRCFKIVKQ